MAISTETLGFPRIGPRREIKFALESYWKGSLPEAELLATCRRVEADAWRLQREAGVTRVGLDGTLYDQVLDTTTWLGVIPERFKGLTGLARYFAMARGAPSAPALDMSKFFDTNYHYLVPELGADLRPQPDLAAPLDRLARGQAAVGRDAAVPIVIGPVTFVCLAKGCPLPVREAVGRLLPAYVQLLEKFKELQVPEVQLHEPILTTTRAEGLKAEFEEAYGLLSKVGVPINLVSYYDDIGATYEWAVQLPVQAVTLDFLGVPGAATPSRTMELIRRHGFPAAKRLGAGVVDGRSVWADDGTAVRLLRELLALGVQPQQLAVTSSAPLQHVPYDVALEGSHVPPALAPRLAFAKQKLAEIVAAAAAAADPAGGGAAGPVAGAGAAGGAAASAADYRQQHGLGEDMFVRSEGFEARRAKQHQTHAFPTTTIGSFPQTAEVRRLRQQLKSGKLTQEEYQRLITGHIAHCIGVQEALGLDVLVHGESERTDMVEYFGVQLDGMWFTEAGWVQSYGSRCVRPPLVVGDVRFVQPMTVWEYKVAQSYTQRPVKGMLTGPVTILNWAFPRKDIPRSAQALQLALALRQEVDALQQAGCKIVQVDEPALREGLPLKAERWDAYLGWAVDAFRLATAVARPETQVVTHLCYSDFDDILPAIDRMDADVLTIENSRSDNAMLRALAAGGYGRDLGPGVYDVHSPQVPPVEFIVSRIRSFLASGVLGGRADRIWVNPDCGLKTRGWPETVAALRNMVAAAAACRGDLLRLGQEGLVAEAKREEAEAVGSGQAGAAAGGAGCNACCRG